MESALRMTNGPNTWTPPKAHWKTPSWRWTPPTVRALAEAMAQTARGDAREYEAYKGAASEVAKRLRRDLRLPGGERLGADISRTAAP